MTVTSTGFDLMGGAKKVPTSKKHAFFCKNSTRGQGGACTFNNTQEEEKTVERWK